MVVPHFVSYLLYNQYGIDIQGTALPAMVDIYCGPSYWSTHRCGMPYHYNVILVQ
jgi:hypothetical protein